jgi:hypothetical protein
MKVYMTIKKKTKKKKIKASNLNNVLTHQNHLKI